MVAGSLDRPTSLGQARTHDISHLLDGIGLSWQTQVLAIKSKLIAPQQFG